jgi:hypothetical protein
LHHVESATEVADFLLAAAAPEKNNARMLRA